MPVQNFSTGKDITLTVVTPNGPLDITGITSFSAKQMNVKLKSKGIDGRPRHGTIPDGWTGTFKFDRLSPALDRFFALQEAAYLAGQNIQGGVISQIISEADGSVSAFRYTDVTLTFDDPGDWAGEKKVEQTISFEADTRIQVA